MTGKKSPEKDAKTTPKKEAEKTKQPNLFGEENQVYNALETEISVVTGQIRSSYERIERIETGIKELAERRDKLKDARDIVRNRLDDFKSVKEKRSAAAKKREAAKREAKK